MEFFTDTKVDFLGKRLIFGAVSLAGIIASIWMLAFQGLNLGIDFLGGTEVELKYNRELSLKDLETFRERLTGADLGDVNIQGYGPAEDREVLVRVGRQEEEDTREAGRDSRRVLEALRSPEEGQRLAAGDLDLNAVGREALQTWLGQKLGEPAGAPTPEIQDAAAAVIALRQQSGGLFTDLSGVLELPEVGPGARTALSEGAFTGEFILREVDFIGPSAGRELRRKTYYSMIGALGGILIYIWVRFRFFWGLAAVAALIHDVIITLGVLAFAQKEFTLPVVAAILTIIGYSLNDTIVVFDRVRENIRIARARDLIAILNRSINQNLSRTFLTSLTTLFAVTTLYIFGGEKLGSLSFALIIGVIVGTYSSVFIASPVLLFWERVYPRKV